MVFKVEMLGGPEDGSVVVLEEFATHIYVALPVEFGYVKENLVPTSPAGKVVVLPIRKCSNGKFHAMWHEREEV